MKKSLHFEDASSRIYKQFVNGKERPPRTWGETLGIWEKCYERTGSFGKSAEILHDLL